MSKIVSTNTNAVFLATLLVLGTLATIVPSAQAEPYYEMDNGYGSYERDSAYTNNDNYEEPRGYPSYKEEYRQDYQSYEYDNDYKSKDKDRNSVSISKINCNTVNYNFNNVAIGNLSIGNNGIGGAASSDGTNGALVSNEGYYDGYQKDKDITCIANINNNNTNIIAGGGGNATDGNGNGNVTDTCEECFLEALGPANFTKLLNFLASPTPKSFDSLEQFCTFLQLNIARDAPLQALTNDINTFLTIAGISLTPAELAALVACLFDVLGGGTDNNTGGLVPFNTNIDTSAVFGKATDNNAGGLASSFSSHTIAQGTEEDLTALEKTEKLKTQWLDLLP